MGVEGLLTGLTDARRALLLSMLGSSSPPPACPADLEPLGRLPRLEALHIEAEGLPRLDGLPASLLRLSLSCFASSARWGAGGCAVEQQLVWLM